MNIAVGQRMPAGELETMTADGPGTLTTKELFAGKKVLLVSVPGAFTPTCSMQHLPGIVAHAEQIRAKGVDQIACMAVNDAFVMSAWGDALGADGKVLMLADGSGDYTRALGLELDARRFGMGMRGQRFALVVDDGVVSYLAVEEPARFDVTRAESLLDVL
jgi:peroxiredoxin